MLYRVSLYLNRQTLSLISLRQSSSELLSCCGCNTGFVFMCLLPCQNLVVLIRVLARSCSHANVVSPVPAVAADAGDAPEDPGSDAHAEGSVLRKDGVNKPLCRTLTHTSSVATSGGVTKSSGFVGSVKVISFQPHGRGGCCYLP